MQKRITWTAGNGSDVELTLVARHELTDGGVEKSGGLLEIEVIGSIDGEEVDAYEVETCDHPVAVARFGAIGMTKANYDRYLTARAELEAGIADHNTKCEANAAKIKSLDANQARIESVMRCGE